MFTSVGDSYFSLSLNRVYYDTTTSFSSDHLYFYKIFAHILKLYKTEIVWFLYKGVVLNCYKSCTSNYLTNNMLKKNLKLKCFFFNVFIFFRWSTKNSSLGRRRWYLWNNGKLLVTEDIDMLCQSVKIVNNLVLLFYYQI